MGYIEFSESFFKYLKNWSAIRNRIYKKLNNEIYKKNQFLPSRIQIGLCNQKYLEYIGDFDNQTPKDGLLIILEVLPSYEIYILSDFIPAPPAPPTYYQFHS